MQDPVAESRVEPAGPRLDDLALARAAGRGDQKACAALVSRLLARVRRTASYLAARDDVDDLAQVALIEILRSAEGFRGESSLETWADRITVRVAAHHCRKRARRRGLAEQVGEPEPIEEPLDDALALRRARGRIATHLAKINPERRTALVLHHVLGHSVAEIAEMTNVPVNTVRDRLRVAREQLRKRAMADPSLREWALQGGG